VGGGRSKRAEGVKGPPINVGRALEGESGGLGQGGDDAAFCRSVQKVGFALDPGAAVRVGARVRARIDQRPVLITGTGGVLGAIDQGATGIEGCLEFGYEMRGRVTRLDLAERRGEADLRGTRRN
jgi:hypothetical protein